MASAPPDGGDPCSTPAAKRRKTSSALFKPFKSPFKGALKASKPTANSTAAATNGSNLAPTSAKLDPNRIATRPDGSAFRLSPSTNPYQTNETGTTNVTNEAAAGRISTPSAPPTPSSTNLKSPLQPVHHHRSTPPSTKLSSLQRQHTTLLSQLSALCSTLDTHTQALKIESSSKDAELSRLVEVWRSASQAAAEELYGGVRDRVNRMGGVGAWREREGESAKRWGGGWDNGDEGNGGARDEEEGGEREEDDEREGEDEGISERRDREEAEAEREEEKAREDEINSGRDDEVGTALLCGRCVGREIAIV
ncbi:hypothetical protein MMC30_008549 [Trapelia coarctata]|nr:hypothetical protein [Trapelia coarctata]